MIVTLRILCQPSLQSKEHSGKVPKRLIGHSYKVLAAFLGSFAEQATKVPLGSSDSSLEAIHLPSPFANPFGLFHTHYTSSAPYLTSHSQIPLPHQTSTSDSSLENYAFGANPEDLSTPTPSAY